MLKGMLDFQPEFIAGVDRDGKNNGVALPIIQLKHFADRCEKTEPDKGTQETKGKSGDQDGAFIHHTFHVKI